MIGIGLALGAAVLFGISDFVAGLASRRVHFMWVTLASLIVSLVVVTVSLPWTSPVPASAGSLVWGALSGLGTAIGSLALYRGFARGEMSVVGPISAVGAALLPAVVGVFLGERLRLLAICAVIVALPAIGLISKGSSTTGASIRAGAIDGCVAGVGFGMLFIGLNRAGGQSGLWPVAAGELAATLLIGLAIVVTRPTRPTHIGPAGLLTVTTGLLGILGTTAYFYATHLGILTLAAVVTSLYPAFTVLLAAIVIHERPNRTQLLGLALGAAAIVGIVAS